MLVAIEGLHRHEIGERIMVVVVLGDELRNHCEVSHASGVHSGEKRMVQNTARGAFLHTNAPAQQNFKQKKEVVSNDGGIKKHSRKQAHVTYSEGSALRMEPISRRAWGLPACWSMREDNTRPFFCRQGINQTKQV